MLPRSFYWGAGLAGAIWFWRRQLRPLAVKGAKAGLLFVDGIRDNVEAGKDILYDLTQDAQMEKIKGGKA